MLKTIKTSLCIFGLVTSALLAAPMASADNNNPEHTNNYQVINRAAFDNYIAMFNNKNPLAFEAYYADNMRMQNGHMVLNGIPEVKEHYRKIWSVMKEELTVVNFLMDGDSLAVELKAHFTAEKDKKGSVFGDVLKGENFDYHGVIIYKINHMGKFNDIKVAYLDFTRTTDGVTQSLGIVH
jgi:hypothetical protein